jgi:hypothetical protein
MNDVKSLRLRLLKETKTLRTTAISIMTLSITILNIMTLEAESWDIVFESFRLAVVTYWYDNELIF